MGFSLFSSEAKQSTQVTDQRAGVEGSGTAISRPSASGNGTLIIGSDEIAGKAIAASTDALALSANFLGDAFTSFLNLTDKRLERADQNNAAVQEFAGEIISKEQETSDDRLMKIVTFALIGGVAIVAIRSGVIKDIVGAIK